MTLIKIKGYEFNAIAVRDSFSRRAQRFYNNIISTLRSIGISEDDIYLDIEPVAIKRIPASVTWYFEGYRLYFSYNGGTKYVENLYVVSKIIEFEVKQILEGQKTIEQFIFDFSESKGVMQERKDARKLLGIDSDSLDLELVDKKYKELAKKVHPDTPAGDTEQFKMINRAHKILKRELA